MEKLLVNKESGEDIIVTVGKNDVDKVTIGAGKPVIISGPCAVEDEDVMFKIVRELKKLGVHILRGGAYKPRTSPYAFQGLKNEGVKILHKVSREVGMPFVTEIMDARNIDDVVPYADMLQIGSRNMYNYTLLKEVGKLDMPVLLKRGMSATISEWLYAAEYIMKEGNMNVVMCERGIRTFENYTRNTLDLNAVAILKNKYRLPVLVDPSHGTGLREIVPTMSLASIAAGGDGLIIESHINPDNAVSDARQTISMEALQNIIDKVKIFSKNN